MARKVLFDLSIFVDIIEDFVDLDLSSLGLYLNYTEIIKSIIMGVSYNSSYNDNPIYNGLHNLVLGKINRHITNTEDSILFTMAETLYRSKHYIQLREELIYMLSPLLCGVMFDQDSINVSIRDMIFTVNK